MEYISGSGTILQKEMQKDATTYRGNLYTKTCTQTNVIACVKWAINKIVRTPTEQKGQQP